MHAHTHALTHTRTHTRKLALSLSLFLSLSLTHTRAHTHTHTHTHILRLISTDETPVTIYELVQECILKEVAIAPVAEQVCVCFMCVLKGGGGGCREGGTIKKICMFV